MIINNDKLKLPYMKRPMLRNSILADKVIYVPENICFKFGQYCSSPYFFEIKTGKKQITWYLNTTGDVQFRTF